MHGRRIRCRPSRSTGRSANAAPERLAALRPPRNTSRGFASPSWPESRAKEPVHPALAVGYTATSKDAASPPGTDESLSGGEYDASCVAIFAPSSARWCGVARRLRTSSRPGAEEKTLSRQAQRRSAPHLDGQIGEVRLRHR